MNPVFKEIITIYKENTNRSGTNINNNAKKKVSVMDVLAKMLSKSTYKHANTAERNKQAEGTLMALKLT
jgi:hypothetical protein